MAGGLFDALDRTDMSRGPADVPAPSGVTWQRNPIAPISGTTPAARHASASGAMVATVYSGTRAQALAVWFLKKGRLTIAEAAVLLNVKEGSVTGPWSRLEGIGWIVGTGEYFTWKTDSGRAVHREYHSLTADGRAAATELQRLKDARR